MIIGLLLLGSLLGMLAALVALILGQSLLTAAAIYLSTAVLCVIGIPLACAFRPRARRFESARQS
jgi:membrane protein implicated in regulation of membrane protease activity